MDGKSGLKLLYSNVQSINNKVDELRAIVDMENPDVIALTETWTNDTINDAYLHLDNYELVERRDRRDTVGGRGGGIMVYAKGIHIWREDVDTEFNQCATLKIKKGTEETALHVVYRSPNSNKENDNMLCEWMEKRSRSGKEEVIVGDFNFPGIDWSTGRSDTKGRSFHEACMDSFLVQHIDQETHRSGHILDLLFTTEENMVDKVTMIGKLGASDHEMMVVDLELGVVKRKETRRRVKNYKRGNYVQMREMMDIQWEEVLRGKSVEEMWREIAGRIDDAVDECVPERKSMSKPKPRWMNNDIMKLIKEKRSAWTRWKRTRSDDDKSKYKELEAKTKKSIRNKKNAMERTIAKTAKESPKTFYSYINSRRKVRKRIGPLREEDGEIVTDPERQAEIFNAHYASVFTKSDGAQPMIRKFTNEKLEDVDITTEIVANLIDELKENSSPGPDEINNRVLKELKNELANPLQMLFRESLDKGEVPSGWKESVISPIFKKGDKGAAVNYRPVNLTSSVCKLMERVLKRQMEEHLEKNVLKNSQHGFRRGRSPQTNLIEFMNKITKWIDEGRSVDIVYFDLSKAFDKVDHKLLAMKLVASGIDGKLREWLCEWLRGRKQKVRVEDAMSGWRDVDSSTPQGTVLGGTLFSIYIVDIDDDVAGFVRKFADDTKAANVVETEEDARVMQNDINVMVEWAKEWKMEFNADKCKVMHLGRRNRRYEYVMDGKKIEAVEEEKDLGVWFGSNMKPTIQCEKAAKEANKALGMITRAFHYRTREVMVPLYKAFVRPKMEHAVSVWRPWLLGEIESLEKVQRRMVRMLNGVNGNSYEEKLQRIGLTTLEERRNRGDMVETYKTLKGRNRVEKNEWFEICEEDARPTRANAIMVEGEAVRKKEVLVGQRANLEVRKHFFNVRVVDSWNALPEEVKMAPSVNAFKNAFDGWHSKQKRSRDPGKFDGGKGKENGRSQK